MNALLLLLALSTSPAADEALRVAQSCSVSALKAYATSSPDPAEAIAAAAFEKCTAAWAAAAQALEAEQDRDPSYQRVMRETEANARRLGMPPVNPIAKREIMFQALRNSFIARATPLVFDIRAAAHTQR